MAGLVYELVAGDVGELSKPSEPGAPGASGASGSGTDSADVCASAGFAEVELVPVCGITAALAGAALLGAPLMNDFAVLSLSDLLTPWDEIEQRLDGAARGGLVLVLYNPSSKKRTDHLARACDIVLAHRSGTTVCGVCHSIGREGATSRLMTLAELRDFEADMFTTVFIGNGHTAYINGRMVTRRGYRHD